MKDDQYYREKALGYFKRNPVNKVLTSFSLDITIADLTRELTQLMANNKHIDFEKASLTLTYCYGNEYYTVSAPSILPDESEIQKQIENIKEQETKEAERKIRRQEKEKLLYENLKKKYGE